MLLRNNSVSFHGRDGAVDIRRNSYGIPEISAASYRDCSFGLGWVHANDRQFRMILTRIILEGRSAEFIDASDELIQADEYIRSLNLYPDINRQKQLLERDVRESTELYAEGVNIFLDRAGISPDFKLLKFKPEPWKIEDTMRLAKNFFSFRIMESQRNFIELLILMIREGLDEQKLKELYPAIDGIINVDLMKKITLRPAPSPGTLRWLSNIPAFLSGSSWAVSGKNAAGGKPILCADPHLEINIMPSVWHEVILRLPEDTIAGFTIPGIPCVISGRNRSLAFSGVNSFADMTDFRIEECRDGKYRRGNTWHHFDVRRETIRIKTGDSVRTEFFENEHGVLEGNPFIDGFYIVRGWPASKNCGARDLNVYYNVMRSKTVRDAMKHYRELDATPFNFVMADTGGNIGCQMSGRFFNRPAGLCGLLPRPAWDRKYDNRGFVLKNRLPSVYNPLNGIVIVADNNMNNASDPDEDKSVAASYRYERIRQMLRNRKKFDSEYMKEIQYDLCSLQAEKFMKVIFPLVDFRKKGRILKEWNMEYRPVSEGVSIFENIYESMMEMLFISNDLNMEHLKQILNDPYICTGFYRNFDSILLNKKSSWFQNGSWEGLINSAVQRGLKRKSFRYGKKQGIRFTHTVFPDRFFSGLKYKQNSFELTGGRATVNHGQVYTSHGRKTVTGASFRIIADMSDNSLLTNAMGNNCDRPFPEMYKNNNKDWFKGIYKKLS